MLINNAGVASFGHFDESSEAILRQIMEVNFFAPAELIRLAIPQLTQGRQPAIVNVASMCGRRGLPAWPEYSASKFALCGLTEALRGEMARFDIDVLLIVPGLTRSDLGRHLLRNDGRMKIDFDAGHAAGRRGGGILRALQKNRPETVLGWEAAGCCASIASCRGWSIGCWHGACGNCTPARNVRPQCPTARAALEKRRQ